MDRERVMRKPWQQREPGPAIAHQKPHDVSAEMLVLQRTAGNGAMQSALQRVRQGQGGAFGARVLAPSPGDDARTAKWKADQRARQAIEKQKLDELQTDKAWLLAGVESLGASADVTELLRSAIVSHCQRLGGRTVYMDRDYPLETVIEAADEWWRLRDQIPHGPDLIPIDGGVEVESMMVERNLRVSSLRVDGVVDGESIRAEHRNGHWECAVNLGLSILGEESRFYIHPPDWQAGSPPPGYRYNPTWAVNAWGAQERGPWAEAH